MENTQNTEAKIPPPLATSPIDLSKYDKYYQEEFRKIIESGEKYKGKWNWYSFLLGTIWCFYKGCWAYGAIIFISLVLTYGGIYWILCIGWSIILGLRGTWLLYNVKIKLKQFPKSLF